MHTALLLLIVVIWHVRDSYDNSSKLFDLHWSNHTKAPISVRQSWRISIHWSHYIDVIMTTVASQITILTVVYSRLFIQAQINENIKAPRHWPLCGEFTGTGEFLAQRASNVENCSIWWRHHAFSEHSTQNKLQQCAYFMEHYLWLTHIFYHIDDCQYYHKKITRSTWTRLSYEINTMDANGICIWFPADFPIKMRNPSPHSLICWNRD